MDGVTAYLPEELNAWVLGGSLLLVIAAMRIITFMAGGLRAQGILPRLLRWIRRGLRVVAVVVAIWLFVALVPRWLTPAVPWVLLFSAVVFVVSARNVLVDLFAGAVLVVERRVQAGQYVHGDGFAGVIDRVHARRTTVRDASDRSVDVPNRLMLGIRIDGEDGPYLTHETRIAIPGDFSPQDVREALEKAVLCTPWTPLEPCTAVTRDGDAWRVRARLLDVRYIAPFEASIAEHATAILALANGPSEPL